MKNGMMTLVLMGLLSACGSAETAPAPTEAPAIAAAAPVAAPPVAPTEPSAPAAAGDLCGRARDCCRAYVAALGPAGAGAEAACTALDQQQGVPGMDTACQAQIDGWRTGLSAMQHEVPAACQ